MNNLSSRVLAAIVCLGILGIAPMARAADVSDSAPTPETYVIPPGTPAYIRNAIESPSRSAEQKARDVNRKPAELLQLSGVKPGDHIVEFASFGQYFTSFLSDIAGPKGSVNMYDLPYTDKRAGDASRAFVAAHPNCKYELVDYNAVELPPHLDIVFMVLYYHDLSLNDIDTGALNAKIFKALKPGGVFFVVDHNAAPDSGRRDTKALHRIDPALIKQEVTAAGFELVAQSDLLKRSSDDHTKMVFAPGLRGLTDQSVFKFRKPAK
jgi:predicted methyltransferase